MNGSSTGTLTPAQAARLQQLWMLLLHLAEASSLGALEQFVRVNSLDPTGAISTPALSRRNSLFARSETARSRRSYEKRASVASTSIPYHHVRLLQTFGDAGFTAAQIRSVRHVLKLMSPEDVRFGILTAAKHENPDTFVLRFLRAAKWDVNQAVVQLLGAIVWRLKEMQVDNVLLPRGEAFAAASETDVSNPARAEDARAFMKQVRIGKGFVHGVDRSSRPVLVIRIRLHRPGDQSETALNQFITHLIESARLVLSPPVETADYSAVKFIIRCVEVYYPESVGLILIHNAPRIFNGAGVWKIIKPWIDPRLVERIHFTRSVEDLEKFMDRDQIIAELGGDEDWEYEYIEPEPDENQAMDDLAARDTLLAERQSLGEDFIAATSRWVSAAQTGDPVQIDEATAHREEIIEQIRLNYWNLDPYVRARNNLDRTGVIQEGGLIEMYPISQPQTPLAVIQTAKVLQVEPVRGRVKVVNV
ncbi:CRAL-TRIO domain-containing protein [Aspergillus foveolatus]|uniref:CRAL-TRIO domain-containing protein n=1 Tax=Aspergillus foveolatus TaxID=210207 RepID=UPI003CCCA580